MTCFRSHLCLFALVLGTQYAVLSAPARAHPVPRRSHDRTIEVRLTPEGVLVHYRLEVDEWTVIFEDLPAVSDKVDLARLSKPQEFYDAYTRSYAPILADNLLATVDGDQLRFTCVRQGHEILDHLRCDFVFRAPWPSGGSGPRQFTFREGNYELETGRIRLSLATDPALVVSRKIEPDEELKARPATELRPGDDARLRKVWATFEIQAGVTASAPSPEQPVKPEATPSPPTSLLTLLLDTQQGTLVLWFLAACFGAAHALTPGHGKTLVAAYLVGECGTVWHALVLGLVTTLTHTGAVLALAAALLLFFPKAVPQDVQIVLGLGGGLLVAGMGFWLLLRRLTGGADHVHLGGHGHHHHHHGHGHADHYHDEHGHAHHLPSDSGPVGWWGLIVLGVSGGIVPCWDAIAMLGFAVSAQRLWLALPLLLAFSTGLAGVLVAIGIAVVYAKGFASSRFGDSRLIRALPIISALLVTILGLWLCYDSVHMAAEPPTAAGL